MNIKEVFEQCNDGDYVIDSDQHIKWKIDEGELTINHRYITNFYTLKGLLNLEFKKVYDGNKEE